MFRLARAGLCAVLALLCVSPSPLRAEDLTAGTLLIRDPWARATPAGAAVAGGYLTVVNRGPAPERLTGGSLEAAQTFELHEMRSEGGVMTMRPTGPLAIPPGGTLTLAPSGIHIMFTGLKRPLKKGDVVAGTLVFDHAGTVPVRFTVQGVGAKAPSGSMPGMPAE